MEEYIRLFTELRATEISSFGESVGELVDGKYQHKKNVFDDFCDYHMKILWQYIEIIKNYCRMCDPAVNDMSLKVVTRLPLTETFSYSSFFYDRFSEKSGKFANCTLFDDEGDLHVETPKEIIPSVEEIKQRNNVIYKDIKNLQEFLNEYHHLFNIVFDQAKKFTGALVIMKDHLEVVRQKKSVTLVKYWLEEYGVLREFFPQFLLGCDAIEQALKEVEEEGCCKSTPVIEMEVEINEE